VTSALVQEGATPVIVGSTGDAGAAADLLAALDPEPRRLTIDLVGGTDLPTLAGVLVHCRALVTNDSGGMHLAAALSVPVIALFGPSNEEHTRPRGRGRSVVLTSPVWCRPCLLKECPIDHRCLRGIAPQRVLNTLEECNQQSAITSQQ
jgi:heptosyltransferase-2